ncbi:unnamed protein product [Pleuronectes platessa]|uniref:Uncharacterized protein n=1 Tax=Pleuronectes platessa TaxID=8262 RepID=A0A9N7VN78_PLEPL|nr:unnamed protein product [Pleuronectes platessa]
MYGRPEASRGGREESAGLAVNVVQQRLEKACQPAAARCQSAPCAPPLARPKIRRSAARAVTRAGRGTRGWSWRAAWRRAAAAEGRSWEGRNGAGTRGVATLPPVGAGATWPYGAVTGGGPGGGWEMGGQPKGCVSRGDTVEGATRHGVRVQHKHKEKQQAEGARNSAPGLQSLTVVRGPMGEVEGFEWRTEGRDR